MQNWQAGGFLESAPPQSPTANAGGDQTVEEGAQVMLNGTNSSDPEGAPLTFNWAQLAGPSVTFSSVTAAQPTFTAPQVDTAGAALEFQLTVTADGRSSNPDTVLINVIDSTAGNLPPRADAGPDQTVEEGMLVTLDSTNSSDPDGTVATRLWMQAVGPMVTLSDPTAPQPTFMAPEEVGATGVRLEFDLMVTDNDGLAATDRVLINVTGINDPPIAQAIVVGPQPVPELSLVTLSGADSTDPEQEATSLTFRWRQTAGPPVTLSAPTIAGPSFTAPDVDTAGAVLEFELMVIDNGGLAATASVTVMVSDVQQPAADIEDGGAGCALNPNAGFDPIFIGLTGFFLAFRIWQRLRKKMQK
jgi:hypothetical protein